MNENRLAVAYMRYSSHNQDEKSIEYQRRVISDYCNLNNLTIVEEYIDEKITGTSPNRKNFKRLINDSKKDPEWSVILIYDYSRLSRKTRPCIDCIDDFENLGFEITSVTQQFGNTNEGKFMRLVTIANGEYYANNCAKYVHAGLTTRAKDSRHCGGRPPLGYDVNQDGRLVINKNEAKIVKKIFEMYIQHYSYSQMAEELNEKGYKTKNGTKFNKNSFYSILSQEKYIGTYTWNKTESKNSQGKINSHKQKDESKQIKNENGCPSIIPIEQFKLAQDIMHNNSKKPEYTKGRKQYLLSNLKILKCAECGAYMIGTKNNSHGKEYDVYYCPNHKTHNCSMPQIKAKNLNKLVVSLILKEIYKRNDLEEIFKIVRSDKDRKLLKEKLRGNDIAINNIFKSLEKAPSELLTKRLNKLQREKKALEKEYNVFLEKVETINKDNAKEVLNKLGNYMMKSQDSSVKVFLQKIIDCITIDHDNVTIEYKAS